MIQQRGQPGSARAPDNPCPFLLLRLSELADLYLSVPTMAIVRCLVEVEFEAERVATSANLNETAGRLAIERLDELDTLYHTD